MRTILRILAIAVATGVAAWLLPGITVSGATTQDQALTLLLVALVIGLVNMWVRPVVAFLTGCLIILTFGLFLLVVNAGMLLFSSWIAQQFGIGFTVDGWWSALFGSIIISIVSGLMNGVFGTDRPVG